MQNGQKFLWQAVIILVLIFGGGWFMGGILNVAAILSPQLITLQDCPSGSTAKEEWIQQSWDHPGEKTFTVTCIGPNGNSVTPLSNTESMAIGYKYFYPAGVVVMVLLVGLWYIRSRRNIRQTKAA